MRSIQLSQENKLYNLTDVRLYLVEGYENIISFKESVPDDELIYTHLIDGCIFKLKQEMKRLLILKRNRESVINFWKGKPKSEWLRSSEIVLYSQFDIDPENEAIQAIESLLQRFGIPIMTVDLDSNVSDFEIDPTL